MTDDGRLPISLVMIASNEEARIGRCLASIADLASEIVVLVNDCTDRTVEIAESYGAVVHEDSWHGFRDQKNLALRHATQPWILSLDCDEEVSPVLRGSLIEFFEKGDDHRYAAARFPRKVWFLGRWIKHGDWYPDHSLRLFPRGLCWTGSPEHDKVSVVGKVRTLDGDLHHFSNPDLRTQIEKINVFADAFLQRQLADGARWSLFHTLFRPFWRFFRSYILKRGYRDGFPGFYIACVTAFGALVRYSRLYEHERMTALSDGDGHDDALGRGLDVQPPGRPDGGASGVPRAA